MPAILFSSLTGTTTIVASRLALIFIELHLPPSFSSTSSPFSFICSWRCPSDSAAPTIAIEGNRLSFSLVSNNRGTVEILKDCSLRVPSGELWMLLGPNGCGKSTLLQPYFFNQVLAGFLKPTKGSFHVNRPKSFVFQNPDHQVVMPTVEADVAFGLGKFDLALDEVRSRVSKALDAVGMLKYSQRPIQTLSGGQKQRVAIAGALAEESKVLLLDELTTFLDEYDQLGVIEAVKNSVPGNGEVAALWVTHRLEELKHADGAFYMENGCIVMHGDVPSVVDFLKRKQSCYIQPFNL
ncbi:hypothetical protein KSP40_PGU015209 [Platanthera guangdongensis]|uniref:ABC transporter domain-containing protein n=1 Tax=Platanthera guangdongensis TaxID=2320717 RepID=A0ABR2MBJ0_9ASPA